MKHAKAKKTPDKTYVICGHHFGYNGEFYYVEGRYIKESFTDKEKALASYAELEVKAARSFDLSEVESLVAGDTDLLETLDDFIYQQSGVHLCHDYVINWGTHLPTQLADTDVLRFVKLAKMQSYKLLTFNGKPRFYALWILAEDNYHFSFNEGMDSLVFSESKQQLADELECLVGCHDWRADWVVGDITAISHSPSLLKQLIHRESAITYTDASKELRVTGYDLAPYLAVNKLLVKPLFEIRPLSLDALRTIDKQISDNFMEEYGYLDKTKRQFLYKKTTKNNNKNSFASDDIADQYDEHLDGLKLVCESILYQTHAQVRDYLFAFGPICRQLVELNEHFQCGFDIQLSDADIFRDFYTNHRISVEDGRFHRFYCDYYYELIEDIYEQDDLDEMMGCFDEAFHFSCVLTGIFQDKEAAAIVRTEFEARDNFEEWRDYVLFLIGIAKRF